MSIPNFTIEARRIESGDSMGRQSALTLSHSPARPPARSLFSFALAFSILLVTAGCSEDAAAPANESASGSESVSESRPDKSLADAQASETQTTAGGSFKDDDFDFAPLGASALSGGKRNSSGRASTAGTDEELRDVIARLQPLQVLLGSWRGTTRREFDGFKAVDQHEWIWDLQTDPRQPALTVTSDKSPYVRTARLTWDSGQEAFVMQVTDAAGVTRTLTGDFTDPVHEEVGSDDKLHRVFRLQFTEATATDGGGKGEYWQLAISQQENNRYLLELDKRRGKAAFRRFDTVSTQRAGTSFALSDSGYAEKTCIISEGLGTTELTYKGRSYWVCCSGCKAAFEEDPEKWIAVAAQRAEARKEAENEN